MGGGLVPVLIAIRFVHRVIMPTESHWHTGQAQGPLSLQMRCDVCGNCPLRSSKLISIRPSAAPLLLPQCAEVTVGLGVIVGVGSGVVVGVGSGVFVGVGSGVFVGVGSGVFVGLGDGL